MAHTSRLSNGRTVIPAPLREQLGINNGDQRLWEIKNGELLVTTRIAQLRQAQALVRKHIPADVSLVDELIAERRAEPAAEDDRPWLQVAAELQLDIRCIRPDNY